MKPPLSENEWITWQNLLDRLDASANDGGDVYEAEAFLATLSKKYKTKDPIKKMETWITREYGPDFDPETMCCYTGWALFKQPIVSGEVWRMGYWREDGELMRVRDLTAPEAQWMTDEPEQFQADCDGFRKWLKKVRKKAEK